MKEQAEAIGPPGLERGAVRWFHRPGAMAGEQQAEHGEELPPDAMENSAAVLFTSVARTGIFPLPIRIASM